MSLFRHVFIYGEDRATDTHLIGPVLSRAIGATAQIVEFVMMLSDIMFLLKNSNPFDGDLRMGLQTLGLPCTLSLPWKKIYSQEQIDCRKRTPQRQRACSTSIELPCVVSCATIAGPVSAPIVRSFGAGHPLLTSQLIDAIRRSCSSTGDHSRRTN